jgi:uncharacterized membrane protein YfhO
LNTHANGNAWFVRNVEKVNSANEELARVCSINTKTTAVVDVSKFPLGNISGDSTGSIKLIENKPNYLKYESNAGTSGLAVFSEVYYAKGWVATIDGQEKNIIRANYILRALEIPEGKHTIEFKFQPKAYSVGNTVTMASSWLVLLALFGSIFYNLREEKKV